MNAQLELDGDAFDQGISDAVSSLDELESKGDEVADKMLNMQDSITTTGDATSQAADSFTELGTEFDDLGSIADSFSTSLSGVSDTVITGGNDLANFADVAAQTGTDLTALEDSVTSGSNSLSGFADVAQQTGTDLGALEESASAGNDAFTGLSASVQTVGDDFSGLNDSLTSTGDAMGTLTENADAAATGNANLSSSMEDVDKQTKETDDSVGGLTTSVGNNTLGVVNFTAGIVGLTHMGLQWDRLNIKLQTSHNRLAISVENARKKDQALNDTIRKGTGDVTSSINAKERLDKALDHLSDLFDRGVRSGKEYDAAMKEIDDASQELIKSMVQEGGTLSKVTNSVNADVIAREKSIAMKQRDEFTTKAVERANNDLIISTGTTIIQTGTGLVQAIDAAKGAKAGFMTVIEKLTGKMALLGGGAISLTSILGGMAGKVTLLGGAIKTGLMSGLTALAAPLAAATAAVLAFVGAMEGISHNFMGFTTGMSDIGKSIGDALPFMKDFLTTLGAASAATADFFTKGIAQITDWMGVTHNAIGEADKKFSELVTAYIKTGSTGRAQTDLQIKGWLDLKENQGMSVDEIINKAKQMDAEIEASFKRVTEIFSSEKIVMAAHDLEMLDTAVKGLGTDKAAIDDVGKKMDWFLNDIMTKNPKVVADVNELRAAFAIMQKTPNPENIKNFNDKFAKLKDDIANLPVEVDKNTVAFKSNGIVINQHTLLLERLGLEVQKHTALNKEESEAAQRATVMRAQGLSTMNQEIEATKKKVLLDKTVRESLEAYVTDVGLANNANDLSIEEMKMLRDAHLGDKDAIDSLSDTTLGLTGSLGKQIDTVLHHKIALAMDTKEITNSAIQHRLYLQGVEKGIAAGADWTKQMMIQVQAEISERGQLTRSATAMGLYGNLLMFSTEKMKEAVQTHREVTKGHIEEQIAIATETGFIKNNTLMQDLRTKAMLTGTRAANDWVLSMVSSVQASKDEHGQLIALAQAYGVDVPNSMALTTEQLKKIITAQEDTKTGAMELALIMSEKLEPSFAAFQNVIDAPKMKEFNKALKDLNIPKNLRDEAEDILKPLNKLAQIGDKAATPFHLLVIGGEELKGKHYEQMMGEFHKQLDKIANTKGVGQPVDDVITAIKGMSPAELRTHADSINYMMEQLKKGEFLDPAKQQKFLQMFSDETDHAGDAAALADPKIQKLGATFIGMGIPADVISSISNATENLGADGIAGTADDLIPKLAAMKDELLNMGVPPEVVQSILDMNTNLGPDGLAGTADDLPDSMTPAQQALVSFGTAAASQVTIAAQMALGVTQSVGLMGDFVIKVFKTDIPTGMDFMMNIFKNHTTTIGTYFKTTIPAHFTAAVTASKNMSVAISNNLNDLVNKQMKAHVSTITTYFKTTVPAQFKATQVAALNMNKTVSADISDMVTKGAKPQVTTLNTYFGSGGTVPKALAASGTAAGTFKTNANSAFKGVDASHAKSEIDGLKTAIDQLKSKTVTITVDVKNPTGAKPPDQTTIPNLSNESSFIPNLAKEVTIGHRSGGGDVWINLQSENEIVLNEQVLGRAMNRQIIKATQNYS